MKTRLVFAAMTVLALTAAVGHAARIEIAASQDTYVQQSTPSQNYGSATGLLVLYTGLGGDQTNALIQFDLGAVPADATIDAAYLRVYQPAAGCSGQPVAVWKITEDWLEGGVTWSTLPDAVDVGIGAIEHAGPCEWFYVNVTSLVAQWHNGAASNHGFMLIPSGFLSTNRTFNSSENPADQPKLLVVYNAESTAMEAEEDAHVSQAAPTTNFGSSPDLAVGGQSGAAFRSYVRFDVSGVPSGATVNFARLRLYQYHFNPVLGGYRVGAHRVTGTWDDASVNWNSAPPDIATPESSKGSVLWVGWLEWDVTNVVQGWVNGSFSNEGLVVRHLTETMTGSDIGTFRSDDYTNPAYRPQLEVFYTEGPPNGFANGPIFTGLDRSDSQWGDLDNDGDMDLVLSGRTASDTLTTTYENDSGSFSVLANSLPGVVSEGSGNLALGDYDNDGDLDLAISGQAKGSLGRITRIYENDGDGGFTWDTAQVLTGVHYSSLAWGDVDNDGDLDLLVQGLDALNNTIATLYVNDGGTLTADLGTSLTGLRAGSVDWGDFDRDGDLDLIRTGVDAASISTTIYSVNDPPGTLTENGAHGLPGVYLSDIAAGDFNRDGNLDLALTGVNNTPTTTNMARIYFNDGAGVFTPHGGNILSIYRSSCAWGDFDNDGRLDVAFCGYNGSSWFTYIYRCLESYGFSFYASVSGVCEGALNWVDYDDDADLDLFISGIGNTRVSKLCRNDGGVANTPPAPPSMLVAFESFPTPPSPGTLHITWSGASDAETTLPGLYYCVRVGTDRDFQNATDDVFSGVYGTPLMGNAGQRTSMELSIPNPSGPYYIQVKTIDSGLMASEWTNVFCTWNEAEVDFVIDHSVNDAFVDLSTPDSTYGTIMPTMLAVGQWGVPSNDIARAYLEFSLGGVLPQGASEVLRAELWLNCMDQVPEASYWVGVREASPDNWNETTITWNNAPNYFKPGWTDVVRIRGAGWYMWDVTRDVRACVDDDLTLVLRGFDPPEGTAVYRAEFWSDEAPSGSDRPYLKLYYATITGIGEGGSSGPERLTLSQNYPNPFNPATRIEYAVPAGPSAAVELRIYDVAGRLVRTLVDAPQPPGIYTVTWDGKSDGGSSVATGVYFYRLQWNGKSESKKMVLLR